MDLGWSFAIVLVVTSFLTAFAVLLTAAYFPLLPRPNTMGHDDSDGTVFLFDDDKLIDATPSAQKLLDQGPKDMSDWNRLGAVLIPRFPEFADAMSGLAETGLAELTEPDGPCTLRARWIAGVARISLHHNHSNPDDLSLDPACVSAMSNELDTLRQVVAHMPILAWQQAADGSITWANRAYVSRVEAQLAEDDALVWPLPQIFKDAPAGDPGAPLRQSLALASGEVAWFECATLQIGDAKLNFASTADAAVSAETSLQNFVQTLTKTFAGLPTGLAIFNRSRELVMFNPALVDLCQLDPQFLTARPSLFVFLDRLREKQMIPEPKDYKSWRQKLTTLEQDAVNGVYEETWALPSGQTYRVSGRPHPDGAVAFLIEDISSEIALTRHFRAELETGQAVIDSLEEAIAVFSPAGVLTMSNAAYAALWDSDPAQTLSEISIRDATGLWASKCQDVDFFEGVLAQISQESDKANQQGKVSLHDGRVLRCRCANIGAGAWLVGFSVIGKSRKGAAAGRSKAISA